MPYPKWDLLDKSWKKTAFKTAFFDKIDNINAVRLALSCATDTEVKLIEPKIYYISGFADDYGKVYRFK